MRTKRNLIQAGLLVLLALPAVVQAQFTYTTNNGTITITKYTGLGGVVNVPDMTNGLPVTSIGNYAFSRCSTLTGITIPNGVNSIGVGTFYYCTNLTSVLIPNSITNLGSYAFYQCSSLTNIMIGTNVTSVGYEVFWNCYRLASVTIPDSVTSVGDGAFWDCFSLTNIAIGTNVTSIGDGAFHACFSLSNVTIPNSVTNIGYVAFANCDNLSTITVAPLNSFYSSVDGVLFDESQTTLIQYPEGKTDNDYTVPNSVTNIGSNAFFACTNLNSVTIPNSVTSIGDWAFWDCINLTSVTIGANVNSIGSQSFQDCYRLTTITIPNSVTSIGSSCTFFLCSSLTNVTIGTNVTSIGSQAFEGCYSLTSITIPSSVTNIGDDAFWDTGLIGIYFQGNAPSLGAYVFVGDNNPTAYYLPGTTGWENFAQLTGLPTALWTPQMQSDASPGVRPNQFGFNINWASGMVIVVEACTNLTNPTWSPVGTNTLASGSSYFSDPQWTNYPGRFYRLRSMY